MLRTWAPLVLAAVVMLGSGSGVAAPGDMVFEREEKNVGVPPSIFPHWIHRIRYRCYVCHPALFEMKAGANDVTMKTIDEGRHCGACHDGSIAFNVEFQTCTRCHAPPEQ
jgi:c(7)-type cytochrome triheme protein